MNGLIMIQSHVRMRQNRTESRSNFLSQVSRHPQGKILCCLGLGRESIFKVQVRKQLHATTCHRTVHAFNKPFKGQGDPCKKPVAPKNFHHVDCWLPTFHLFCVINHNTVLNVGGGCCHYCYRFSARLIIWTRGFTARIIQWKLLGVSSRGLLPHRLLCMICPTWELSEMFHLRRFHHFLLSWNGNFLLGLGGFWFVFCLCLVVVLFMVAVSCLSFHSALSHCSGCCNK